MFIRLTGSLSPHNPIFVNVDHIISFHEDKEDGTVVAITKNDCFRELQVRESAEEVSCLLLKGDNFVADSLT